MFKREDKVDTGIFNSDYEPISENSLTMLLYFNLGFEGRVESCKFQI